VARIPLALEDRTKRPSFLTLGALGYATKSYGAELDSALVMSHHPGVFWPWALMEMAGQRRRSVLPEHLDHLVVFVTAVHLGCSWCVDFGASLWERKRLDPATLKEAARWRSSDALMPTSGRRSGTPRRSAVSCPRSPTSWSPTCGNGSAMRAWWN